MASEKDTTRLSKRWGSPNSGQMILLLTIVFSISVLLSSLSPSFRLARALLGLLLLVVPGVLLAKQFGLGTRSLGEFAMFAGGLSLVVVSVLSVVLSVVGSELGLSAPLSVGPLLLALAGTSGIVLLLMEPSKREFGLPQHEYSGSVPVLVLVFFLPTMAVVAALAMNLYGTNHLMYVFFLAVIVVTILSASSKYVPDSQLELVVFFVSVSTLLQRNLLGTGVVGADIQFEYFVARFLVQSQFWSPGIGGSILSLPIVTSVPAVIATLTGMEVSTVFKVVYVLVFSLVPVGVYCLARDIFGHREALFGSLVFLFYHGSFYFTPGKQLVSELFVVLLLLLFFRTSFEGYGNKAAALVLGIGLIHSHYGSTYVFGLSLLVASVALTVLARSVDDVDHELSISYPAAFLVLATGWYAYASDELLGRLASVPVSVLAQIRTLLSGAPVGSGASYAQSQTELLEVFNLSLYVLVTLLLGLGVVWAVADQLVRIKRGRDTPYIEYIALAVPLFVFLGASFFVIANLWADRVYQMVLVVLAPFVPIGYRVVGRLFAETRTRIGIGRPSVNSWTLLAVVIALLLAFNSGLAFALTGTAQTSAFNPDANDLAFSKSEHDGATWINRYGGVVSADPRSPTVSPPDDGEGVLVYTGMKSTHLFRATSPSSYTNVDVVRLKTYERPQLQQNLGDGYVYIREDSILRETNDEPVHPSRFTTTEVASIVDRRNVVYSNGHVRIVEVDDGVGAQ